MLDTQEIIATAEAVLNHRYGGQQQLTEPEELSGTGATTVLRLRVANNPVFPHRSVVVKYSPQANDAIDDAAFMREVVAYQFTTSLSEDVRPGPVLLGYDIERRTLILSDVGNSETFADLLEQSDDEARVRLLRNLGTSLGKMHAGTAGAETSFNILLARMVRSIDGAREIQIQREAMLENRIQEGVDIIREAGIEMPADVAAVADTVQVRMLHGGSRAFTPFDLSPDNIVFAERAQFLDYEWAGFRDVVADIAGVIAGFPQYISARPISEEETAVFLEAWVAEVGGVWPSVLNPETLQARITAALVGWSFFSASLLEYTRSVAGGAIEGGNSAGAGMTIDPDEAEARAIRRDVAGTFDALARYADTGTEPTYAVVANFARRVVEWLV
ncbi:MULTISPECIES: phosphotransferase [unclassified Corynebacterium]|uniref:phosphotransferase n=1 Tax=unclassified Corynebacterium TaxID=2624378 RepID=UPI00265308DC|nr:MULTISPECIES: phosphotransferase [unclassified Corynebacterium]MDN8593871.1 phosphotransferase [Corynebacterium sp. P4_F2]WKK55975.1 phosphotransferase [Corynebacterium sp. P4-C1]WKK63386.1 phosphotransferase [Corynebacterium sp. P8-C1]